MNNITPIQWLVALFTLGFLITACSDGSNTSNITNNDVDNQYPVWSPDGTQIAFVSYRDGASEVFVMDADGSNLRQPTNNNVRALVWSPDGTQIAYKSVHDGDIFVMDADGSNVRQLTYSDVYPRVLVWSPDGTQIAFTSTSAISVMNRGRVYQRDPRIRAFTSNSVIFVMDADGSNFHRYIESPPPPLPNNIFVMDADGSNLRQLTSGVYTWDLVWSPDGTQIAFTSADYYVDYYDDHDERLLFVVDADGSNLRQLTNNDIDDQDLVWSPDGTRITFTSNRAIFVVDADGSNLRQLTGNNVHALALSPDGTQIVFIVDSDGVRWSDDAFSDHVVYDDVVFVVDADGSNLRQLIGNNNASANVIVDPSWINSPSWSPDGTQIAFISDFEVFVVDADGSNLRQLTNNNYGGVWESVWSPDGTQIAFHAHDGDNYEVFVVDADGSNLRQLTGNNNANN